MTLDTTQEPASGANGSGYVMLPRERRERTPLNAYVALPGQVRRGPDEVLPGRRDLLGHLLSHDPAHPVIRIQVRDAAFWHADGRPLGEKAARFVEAAWRTGRLGKPRYAQRALAEEFPALAESRMALVVVRVPVRGGRTLGLGFALDTILLGGVLWDESGPTSDRLSDFLVRRYGGQQAREAATLRHQADLRLRESELPVPTTRFQAVKVALEWALMRDILWRLPGDILDHLTGSLRAVVAKNLDELWDDEAGTARDCAPQDLVRWTPGT